MLSIKPSLMYASIIWCLYLSDSDGRDLVQLQVVCHVQVYLGLEVIDCSSLIKGTFVSR